MKTVKHQLRRLVALVLALAMCLPALPAVAAAEDETTTVSTWTQVDLEDISSSDEIAITMTTSDGTVYALPTANTGSSKAPTAVIVTAEDDTLSIEATGDDYAWTFTADEETEGGYIITSPSGDYLYTTNANNGVRVNTTEMTWTLDGNYLYSSTTGRWLGVYTTNPDWRAYTNTTGNTAGQTVGFWKYSGETTESGGGSTTVTVETPSLTYSETDKTVTFKCATSGVTYYYSYSESG
ncbi:MAG: hypothetical protein LUC47_03760, partial [Clostridiales bacterium]|nr:hypothetical protein [Clostridiales bacterium]